MSDERLTELETRVTDLRIANARLSESLQNLATAVSGLTGVVQELRDSMNRGRGALWLLGGLAATVGGIVSWATTLLFHRP